MTMIDADRRATNPLVLPFVFVALALAGGAGADAPNGAEPDPRLMPVNAEVVMRVIKHSDQEIVITRTFAAAPDAVFAALTDPNQIPEWMGTREMQLATCEAD